jgi:hypothetical protein
MQMRPGISPGAIYLRRIVPAYQTLNDLLGDQFLVWLELGIDETRDGGEIL